MTTEKILEIKDLTVSFDGFKAINELNLSLEPGELRVIIGPNGAGKTTLQDVITGKVQPTTGQVYFKGRNITGLSEHQVARLGIGRKFQTPRVYLNLTVRANLDLACNRNKNLWSTLFQKASAQDKRHVVGLLETIGLTAKADLSASLLSHGEKQRLEIGMLVAQSPELLLVDEPVAGLTDEETENIGALLLALAESHSIIVIEHDMEFVRQIARQVTVLHQGSVLFEGTMDEVQTNPQVIEVYLGKSPELSAAQARILQVMALFIESEELFDVDAKRQIIPDFCHRFAPDVDAALVQEDFYVYLAQDVELEFAIAQLQTPTEREQVLQLCEEILESQNIDPATCEAYQTLTQLIHPTPVSESLGFPSLEKTPESSLAKPPDTPVEEPLATVKEPPDTPVEEPLATVEEPSDTPVEEPAASIEDPSDTPVDEPSDTSSLDKQPE